jgi:gliding motility-associated-like protein
MRYYLSLILVIISAFAKAQLESSNWYFGENAGINFSGGVATPINDGQLVTLEGCATISDSGGNLLFYTDGSLVYNRNHQLMPNGSGLKGNSSSTSSAIIVPVPQSRNRYYILTVDTDDQNFSQAEGLHYSIVDLTLDNGNGDVDVFEKNINLLPVTSEKLTAVKNSDDSGYWIVTQFEDRFYSYEITSSGLNIIPVISQVGPFIELVSSPFTNVDVAAMRGYIKLNANGDRLVAAHFSNNTTLELAAITDINQARRIAYTNGGELYLYDFDNSTGVIFNPQPLMTRQDGGSFYGVEFSANGSYLYAEADFMIPGTFEFFDLISASVYQFDLNASNIIASRTTIYNSPMQTLRGALQLGLDNKIYHAVLDESILRTIELPDAPGTGSNYTVGNFFLSTGTTSQYGLPIFIQSFITTATIEGEDHCFGFLQEFNVNANEPVVSILWGFGDPSTGSLNSSTAVNPSHLFSTPGIYVVTAAVETTLGTATATLTVEVFPSVELTAVPQDITLCNKGFNQAVFDLTESINTVSDNPLNEVVLFKSFDDAINQSASIDISTPFLNESNRQTLFVRISNANCFEIVDFSIGVENCDIEIFNAVTPNEDGKNDTFFISGLRDIYLDYKLKIFNRYGQQIWEGSNEDEEWNGVANMGLAATQQKLPTGTYFYILELNDGESAPYSGYVYLQ